MQGHITCKERRKVEGKTPQVNKVKILVMKRYRYTFNSWLITVCYQVFWNAIFKYDIKSFYRVDLGSLNSLKNKFLEMLYKPDEWYMNKIACKKPSEYR